MRRAPVLQTGCAEVRSDDPLMKLGEESVAQWQQQILRWLGQIGLRSKLPAVHEELGWGLKCSAGPLLLLSLPTPHQSLTRYPLLGRALFDVFVIVFCLFLSACFVSVPDTLKLVLRTSPGPMISWDEGRIRTKPTKT